MRKRLEIPIVPGFSLAGDEIYHSLEYSTYYEPLRHVESVDCSGCTKRERLYCFTNFAGDLVFSLGLQIIENNGMSLCSRVGDADSLFYRRDLAEEQDEKGRFKGIWTMDIDDDGTRSIGTLESQRDGYMKLWRFLGLNMPRLHYDTLSSRNVEKVLINDYPARLFCHESGWAVETNMHCGRVYMDYDDTVTINTDNGTLVNDEAISLVIRCRNRGIPVVLISKHDGDLLRELQDFGISGLFDEVRHIKRDSGAEKSDYITEKDAILIDDSFGERWKAHEARGINTFEPCMMELILND